MDATIGGICFLYESMCTTTNILYQRFEHSTYLEGRNTPAYDFFEGSVLIV